MKKKCFIRKDEEAVSPVIATILMVAITVVLAAVLYIMVIGLTPTTGGGVPTGSFSKLEATSSTTAKISFGKLSNDPKPVNLKLRVENATAEGTYTFPANADQTTLTLDSGDNMGTIVYRDLADNGKVNSGDWLEMSNLGADSDYIITLIWGPSGDLIDQKSFSTPAG